MKRIALTGGIASGKSTISQWISEMGTPVVDADFLCRQVMMPGTPATLEIARRWPGVMDPAGAIHRQKLGALLFGNPALLREEESIVLPRIQEAFDRWSQIQEAEKQVLCVYDAALIFEHGLEKNFDGVLLVSAPRNIQISRVMLRDGLSMTEACRRIDSQMPVEEKSKRATWMIQNDGNLDVLRSRFLEVWSKILSDLENPL